MKIGILTFHRAYNYGAILQAFALQKKLLSLGYDSEIIDYLSVKKQKQTKLFSYKTNMSVKQNLTNFVKDFYRKKKNRNFDLFMLEEMQLSKKSYSSFEEMAKLDNSGEYDVYIVGSDQVWNSKNNLRDKTFLLSFVSDNNKRCSYAASIGSDILDTEMTALYSEEIKKFRVLSVRERSAIEKYDFLKQNNAIEVLDPTLLLEKSDYEKIASKRKVTQKYAFIYTIANDRNLRSYARKFCKEKGIVLIDSKKSSQFFKNSDPRDFLSYFIHADYIFTNSFHGTAFSIILNKQFAVELKTAKSLNNRSRDLLLKTNLLDRDIDSENFNIEQKIDYIKIAESINALKLSSTDILKQIAEVDKL